MLAHLQQEAQDKFPRAFTPECIRCGDYNLLITELRESPDQPAPSGYLWQVTDRSLLIDFAAGTVGIAGSKGYQQAISVASKTLSAIAATEPPARNAYQWKRR